MNLFRRAKRNRIGVVLAACAAISTTLAAAGAPQILSGHVPAAAQHAAAVGSPPATQQLQLTIGLPLRNKPELDQLLKDLYDPASPRYHQYLSTEEFTARFGPTAEDYKSLIAFARTNGLEITTSHPNRTLLGVRAPIATVEKVFHMKLRLYKHPKENRTFFAPDTEPSIDLGIPILHISGLDNYVVPRPNLHAMPAGSAPQGGQPATGSGPSGTYRGADFRAAYARGTTLTGAGQRVGLLQFDGYYPGDISTYESQAGQSPVQLINVLLDDYNGTPGTNTAEVSLDIEMAISMAPGLASVIVYEGGPNGNPDDILNRMATDNLAKQLSASWTFGIDAMTDQIFQEFAVQGQSYFNASGDSGAYVGAVDAPADDPNITVVGGTTLTTSSPNGPWVSETAWNWNSTGRGTSATSGGISTTYAIPSWQQGVSMATNGGSTTMRNLPDVAMVADNIWVAYGNGNSGAFGGTSCATPLWAGFMALVNQQAVSAGLPTAGFINPAVYGIGQGAGYGTNFHDTATGNNTNSSSPTRFFAVAGYDLCTGWGSPSGVSLINTLAPRANARVVLSSGATILSEGCQPANGAIDPGETVTVNFGLKNVGGVKTTNLVATLQADSGVLFPSGPATYGSLAAGGTTVNRAFTFTANGLCGGGLTATLQLQDGTANLGTVTFNFVLGQPITVLTQSFDSVTAPTLPSGWTTAVTGSGSNWFASTLAHDTAPNAAFAGEPALPGVSELISPVIPIATTSAQLSFQNFYNMECDVAIPTNAYDGGVLEIKIGNGAFTDILAAGGSFVSGGYTRKIDPTDDNPLDGRQVWSGLSGGFITTLVNLPAAAAGQNIHLKWRLATDTANFYGASGWYIDSVFVQDGFVCCNSLADLALGQSASPTPAVLGQPLTYSIGVTSAGPEPAYSVTVTDTLPANVTFISATPGAVYANGAVTLALGTLFSNAVGNFSVVVSPTTSDPLTNMVTVGSVTADPNPANNASILVTTVSTNQPPTVTAQPTNTVVLQGSNATFQVSASGNGPLSYQWEFNSTNLPGATGSALNLTGVQSSQAGPYTVIITNSSGSTTSSVARLTVLVAPLIKVAGFSANGANVSISLNSVTGASYTLEYKNSLLDPSWTPIGTAQPGNGGVLVLQDTNTVALPSRFYRVDTHQ